MTGKLVTKKKKKVAFQDQSSNCSRSACQQQHTQAQKVRYWCNSPSKNGLENRLSYSKTFS